MRTVKLVVHSLVCFVSFVALAAAGAEPVPKDEAGKAIRGQSMLATAFPGLEVVRCIFDEARLVVRYRGELMVLHSGERLAAAGLKFSEATGDRIVLESAEAKTFASGAALPKVIVVLSKDAEGLIDVKLFSSEVPEDGMTLEVPHGEVESSVNPSRGVGPRSTSSGPSAPGQLAVSD